MPLFKEQVALEACPAKTAESVSYAATIAVLGWLLVSNYYVLSTEQVEDIPVADTQLPILTRQAQSTPAATTSQLT